ncbi:Transcription antitermination protein NusG [hydrothermal vent metagenome]|uniref:Transcription antitermination protein NusG n=1 Tax=hydrothermal vent metagenome TaxID=652676 RepID=A0A1W1C156_9ZZZZ
MSKKWYVVQVMGGYENKIKLAIQEAAQREGLEERFGEILIPTESVVDIKDGKKREQERKFFPGYILVELDLDEKSWFMVKNLNNVMGFIGGTSGKPQSITQREVDKIFAKVQEGIEQPKPKVMYQIGEEILVKDGPFKDFNGSIEKVDYEESVLKVSVLIFGRSTPVELAFDQVEKL